MTRQEPCNDRIDRHRDLFPKHHRVSFSLMTRQKTHHYCESTTRTRHSPSLRLPQGVIPNLWTIFPQGRVTRCTLTLPPTIKTKRFGQANFPARTSSRRITRQDDSSSYGPVDGTPRRRGQSRASSSLCRPPRNVPRRRQVCRSFLTTTVNASLLHIIFFLLVFNCFICS